MNFTGDRMSFIKMLTVFSMSALLGVCLLSMSNAANVQLNAQLNADTSLTNIDGTLASMNVTSGVNATFSPMDSFATLKHKLLERVKDQNQALRDYYNDAIQLQQSSKGAINVTPLLNIVVNGTRIITGPFLSATQMSKNVSELKATSQDFCIYTGCQGNTTYSFLPPYALNYHVAARYQIQRDWLVLTHITDKTWPINQTKVDNAKSNLTIASDELFNVTGWNSYTGGQESYVWSHINNATSGIGMLRK